MVKDLLSIQNTTFFHAKLNSFKFCI